MRLIKYAAVNGTKKVTIAHSDTGPQNDEVKRLKRSGIATSLELVWRNEIAGMVNAYLFGRTSGRSL